MLAYSMEVIVKVSMDEVELGRELLDQAEQRENEFLDVGQHFRIDTFVLS